MPVHWCNTAFIRLYINSLIPVNTASVHIIGPLDPARAFKLDRFPDNLGEHSDESDEFIDVHRSLYRLEHTYGIPEHM